MSDDNEQVSSIFSANQHTQPSRVFDLNTFSAMSDAYDESDSELTNGLEEAITSKKHDLSAWSQLYRRTLLKMHKNPLDINYQMWQKEAIQLLEVVLCLEQRFFLFQFTFYDPFYHDFSSIVQELHTSSTGIVSNRTSIVQSRIHQQFDT
ncbi:MAG: hypothetical protein J3R72DRAFT_420402 [Linnemannia gamsii]|nr:MAG: hypothetical protein J3R72DRAFT_420402 [Linnemannia gamsii]